MRILTDGTVVVCCVDDAFESVIGSVIDSSIADIWCGPMYESLRTRQHAGDFRSPEICYDCNCWTGFFAPRSYKYLQPNIILGERPLSIVAKRSK
ncbi:SPASM domain-containing protein [uncultured Desulfobacter sp.]|uniref:SPASM domain-containing protein n=1 Tax=uncultured Desulfobacter sp. TaxID=240139 RepID=UPI0037497AAA